MAWREGGAIKILTHALFSSLYDHNVVSFLCTLLLSFRKGHGENRWSNNQLVPHRDVKKTGPAPRTPLLFQMIETHTICGPWRENHCRIEADNWDAQSCNRPLEIGGNGSLGGEADFSSSPTPPPYDDQIGSWCTALHTVGLVEGARPEAAYSPLIVCGLDRIRYSGHI